GGLSRTRPQPLEEVFQRRRDDEDQQRARHLALDDGRALNVDLEDHIAALGERLTNLVARRPVPVLVDLARLEERAGGALPGERLAVEEVVVDAVHLA